MSKLSVMHNERVMSFPEIGEKLGMTSAGVTAVYHRALNKLKVHMRTREEWIDLLQKGHSAEVTADLILAVLRHSVVLEKGQGAPRHEQTADGRSFKMACRAFVRGVS
jgi:hypothetical protein